MCWNIIQHYLFVYHSLYLLYYLLCTFNVTGCTLLKHCNGQLAMSLIDSTLCGYMLEYYVTFSIFFITANICYIALYLLSRQPQ